MMNNLEMLLEVARIQKEVYNDKTFCVSIEIEDLIKAGANVNYLNRKQKGGDYISEVNYKKYIFVCVSEKPVDVKGLTELFSLN